MKTTVWKLGKKINICIEFANSCFEFRISKRAAILLVEQLTQQLEK